MVDHTPPSVFRHVPPKKPPPRFETRIESFTRSEINEPKLEIDEHRRPLNRPARSKNIDELIPELNVEGGGRRVPVPFELNVEEYVGPSLLTLAQKIELINEQQQQRILHRSWYKIFLQVMAGILLMLFIQVFTQVITSHLLMYIFWEDILINPSMVILELIQSVDSDISSFIPFPVILILVANLLIWKYELSIHELKLVWKYNFWLLLGIIFKSNNLALKFADFVRKIIPHLAPCNALGDDVSCSATTSTFVARTHCDGEPVLPVLWQVPIMTLNQFYKHTIEAFSSEVFEIGAGFVIVTKCTEDQFNFTCVVRGEIIEDFVAITDCESMATILRILEFWKRSPKVGVIENPIQWNSGIYCHALNIKKIVEGVHKSLDYFSVFQLQEERQFFVGCGRGSGMSMSKKAEQSSEQHVVPSALLATVIAVGAFYQLKDDYNKVAIASLVILIGLATLIFFMDFFGLLFKQSCFYWICTMLCCTSEIWRLEIYLWLKKRNYSLAYCDEFKPDQLQSIDSETEVIYLHKSLYKSRKVLAVAQKPDWPAFQIMDINYLDTSDVWRSGPNGNNDIQFKLYTDPNNPDVVVSMMVYLYSNCVLKSRRTVLARSKRDRDQRGGLKDTMTSEVSLDGEAATYQWPVDSFHLFVYLMLKWRVMNHGIIENWEDFLLNSYYHVLSTHGLAMHIEKHKLVSYFLLLGDQQPSIPCI